MHRRSLHLALVLALLVFGWFQLAHELKAHVHQPDHPCEVCLFTGHLGHGATTSINTLAVVPVAFHYETSHYVAPLLAQPFRLALSQRGPPHTSPT